MGKSTDAQNIAPNDLTKFDRFNAAAFLTVLMGVLVMAVLSKRGNGGNGTATLTSFLDHLSRFLSPIPPLTRRVTSRLRTHAHQMPIGLLQSDGMATIHINRHHCGRAGPACQREAEQPRRLIFLGDFGWVSHKFSIAYV